MITNLENEVLLKILSGDDEVLTVLKSQIEHLNVVKRERSSAGFFTEFENTSSNVLEGVKLDFKFGDVIADVEGLEIGVGFLLYVENGLIKMLEGYTFDEILPKDIKSFSIRYDKDERDMAILKDKWLIDCD